MLVELLQIPERRNTILPEPVQFFEDTGGALWKAQLEKFLRAFTGTEFVVPSPQALTEIARDEVIVREFHGDTSVEGRVAILRKHKITYEYLPDDPFGWPIVCALHVRGSQLLRALCPSSASSRSLLTRAPRDVNCSWHSLAHVASLQPFVLRAETKSGPATIAKAVCAG